MKPNNPQQPSPQEPNLQMTPVEFAPPKKDAVGFIVPAAQKADNRFPVFVPLFILLLTLNFTTLRDIMALNQRIESIRADDESPLQILSHAGKQNEYMQSLQDETKKLGLTDPVAAQIVRDFFTPPPEKKQEGTDVKAPAN